MKLIGRQPVEGTTPTVYIGHRTYRDRYTRRQKVSKTWYAEYCLEAQRHYEPLRTTNRAAAVKGAHAIVQRMEAGQPNASRRRVAVSELKDVYMTMQRNRGRAPKTLEKYEYVLNESVIWAEATDARSANSFSERDFWAFNQVMTDAELSAKTRYDRLVIVKQCFKYAWRTKLIATNPLAGIAMDKPGSAPQPCFTPDQVAVLLDKADPHEAAIFATMAYTGMRFGEVRDLRPTDLLWDQGAHGFIVVQRGGSAGTTKGRRMRRIPIHPSLRDILKKLPTHTEAGQIARVGLVNAADGGMDVCSNFAFGAQVKHAVVGGAQVRAFLGQSNSPAQTLICRSAAIEHDDDATARAAATRVISEADLIAWSDLIARGRFGPIAAQVLRAKIASELRREFPGCQPGRFAEFMCSRGYDKLPEWKVRAGGLWERGGCPQVASCFEFRPSGWVNLQHQISARSASGGSCDSDFGFPTNSFPASSPPSIRSRRSPFGSISMNTRGCRRGWQQWAMPSASSNHRTGRPSTP